MSSAKLVVVLGMHRSGTSAITRALQVLGVDLGDRLMPAHEQINARGFWEDLDIYELNVEMLLALGTEWYQTSPITAADVRTLQAKGFLLKAVELLRRKMAHCEVYGFKDPRLGRLLPFWREVFLHDGLDVRYVLALRNPMSVAASLRKRDGFEDSFSYLLWLVHTVGCVGGSAESPRIAVDFDRLMQDPRGQLQRIAALLEREVEPQAMDAFAGEFLSEDLRHSTFRADDMRVDPNCPQLVTDYFVELMRAAADDISLGADSLVQRHGQCCAALDGMALAIRAMDRLQAEAIGLRASARGLQARTAERDELQRQISQHGEQAAQFQQQLGAAEGRAAEAAAELARQSAQVFELQGALAAQTDALAQSQRLVEEQGTRLAGLEQELTQQREQTGQVQQQLGDAERRLAEAAEQDARQSAALLELQGTVAAQSDALAHGQIQLEDQRSQLAGLQQALDAERERNAQLQQQVSAAEAGLAEATAEHSLQSARVLELEATVGSQADDLAQSQRLADEQSSRIAAFEQELVGQREQTLQIHEQLRAKEASLTEAVQENVRQGERVLELQEALNARTDEWTLARQQVAELEELSREQASALAQREQSEADLRKAIAEAQAAWDQYSELTEAEQSATAQLLQETQQRLVYMMQRAERAERENNVIRASWLWRLAAPLRPRLRRDDDSSRPALLDR